MSTAREIVSQAIGEYDRTHDITIYDDQADAVLAALREHWTSDNTIRNAIADALARFDARLHASDADRKVAQDAAYAVSAAVFEDQP